MSMEVLSVRLRRDRRSLADLEDENPLLYYGEMAFVEMDDGTLRLKIGDGRKNFNDLIWYDDISRISDEEKQAAYGVAELDANGKIIISQFPEVLSPVTYISRVPEQSNTLTYNGESQEPEWYDYDPETLLLNGPTEGTDAGTYTVSFQPASGYAWDDGTQGPVYVDWEIERDPSVDVPEQVGTLVYGDEEEPEWDENIENVKQVEEVSV